MQCNLLLALGFCVKNHKNNLKPINTYSVSAYQFRNFQFIILEVLFKVRQVTMVKAMVFLDVNESRCSSQASSLAISLSLFPGLFYRALKESKYLCIIGIYTCLKFLKLST